MILLADLPAHYKPLIMALEDSGFKVNADLVRTKLVQEARSNEATSGVSYKCYQLAIFPQKHTFPDLRFESKFFTLTKKA